MLAHSCDGLISPGEGTISARLFTPPGKGNNGEMMLKIKKRDFE